MAQRVLQCAIEDVGNWQPQLFLEPHVVAGVAVLSRYSGPPARVEVECENIASRWLGKAPRFTWEVTWNEETVERAERLRATIQSKPLVEYAAIALGLLLAQRLVSLGQLEVTAYGDRADYRSLSRSRVIEISGTETLAELGRRHRQKTAQALANPFGWDAYVIVCAFSARGHRIRFSGHEVEEKTGGRQG